MTIAIISMIREAWGGSEELWYQMAQQALSEGHRVIHYSFETPSKHPKIFELEQKGMIEYDRPGYVPEGVSQAERLFHLGINYLSKKIINPFTALKTDRPDVILYNGTCYSIANEKELVTMLEGDLSSIPFFYLGHLNHDLRREITNEEATIVRRIYGRSRKVFFVSERNLQTATRDLCCDIPNSQVIRNPVNMNQHGVLAYPPDDCMHLALVGNLVTIHKGQDILFQVLQRPHWRNESWKLNIYGSGSDESYLRMLSQYYKLDHKIIFHGRIQDIRGAWEHNHMLLMPSHMEGMPLAVVEAMLCGRTCVATDVGGHKEWIDDGVTGFIAEGSNADAIDHALRRSWQRRHEWDAMGRSAYDKALSLYDPLPGKTLLDLLLNR